MHRFPRDMELGYLALNNGLDIKSIPVRLEANDTSSIRLARDAMQGFIDTFRINYHHVPGRYRSERLETIVTG